VANEFEPQAYAFTPLKAETVKTGPQWIGRLVVSSLPDLLFAAFGFLGVAWFVCRLVTPAGGHGGSLWMVSAVVGAGCLFYAAKAFIHRCDAAIAARSNRLLHTLCVTLEADFSRFWEPAALYRGLAGLRERLEHLRQAYRRGLLAAGLVVCGTAAAGFALGASAAILVLASALGLGGLQALGGYVARGKDGALEDAGLAAHRQRLTALRGIGRLGLLHASAWSFADGVRRDDLETHLGRPGKRAGALAESLAPALAATVLWAAGFQLYRLAFLVPLIWLAGLAGMEIGRQLSQALAAPTRRQAADKLLAGPRAHGRQKVRDDWSLVSVRNLTYAYPGRTSPIFDRVSLDVRAGNITVLTGPSGAGKSTLLRILLGMQRASAGQVLVDGQYLDSIDLSAWRRSLAGVFQGEMLEQTATIRGQLSTGTMHPISRIWDVLEIVEMAAEVQSMPMGLQTIVEPGRISNGQQQRLLIAKALLITPRLLVLDEATNAIPEEMQQRIFRRLRAQKVGCLIVTHRQSVIDAADAVYLVNETVRFVGDGAQWMARGQGATFAAEEAGLA
jgi:ABC-type multidrug transport system fused ATPase/permease subunit